jgi:3',5'-cyclic AMP phosphodiesterase CpdA
MPRVALWHDLHIDIENNAWPKPPHLEADVLVVPGDVGPPLVTGLRWLVDNVRGPSSIVMACGNHEFYKGLAGSGEEFTYYQDQLERGREVAASIGVDLLINDSVVIDRVRYLGTTAWTDISLLPDRWSRKMAMYYSQNGRLPDEREYGGSRRDRHNDFSEIRYGAGNSRHRLTPAQWLQLHAESYAFIESALAQPFDDGPTVLVTHMGPASSVSNRGMNSWLYGSRDLEALCAGPNGPDFFFHGHVHESFDYMLGDRCRVVCNPRGYPDRNHPSGRENPSFDPHLILEIGPDLDLTPTWGM